MRVPQRGRAIVRRLSPHDMVRAFRPGDFLLTRSDAGLARLLGWCTGSELNHAAIIIDPLGTVIEATPTFTADGRAFRLSSVGEYLRQDQPCWVGYVELREGTRQEVVAYAEHLLRARGVATFAGRIWLALHAIFGLAPSVYSARHPRLHPLHNFLDRHAFVVREEHCFSSGELVARALERGGFIWDCGPAHVTPADLFQRYYPSEAKLAITPLPLDRQRRTKREVPARQPSSEHQTPITSIASRRRETLGATALEHLPHHDEAPEAGLRALLQVGIFVAAGLAAIGILEQLLRFTNRDI